MIPVILSTGSLFNFDVDTVMALAAETGFDGVELMVDWRRETPFAKTYQPLQAANTGRPQPIYQNDCARLAQRPH